MPNKEFNSLLKSQCISCCLSKSHTLPFPAHFSQTTGPFNIIHKDVWALHLNLVGYTL